MSYRTGFCRLLADVASHLRCRGDYTRSGGAVCSCRCHWHQADPVG